MDLCPLRWPAGLDCPHRWVSSLPHRRGVVAPVHDCRWTRRDAAGRPFFDAL